LCRSLTCCVLFENAVYEHSGECDAIEYTEVLRSVWAHKFYLNAKLHLLIKVLRLRSTLQMISHLYLLTFRQLKRSEVASHIDEFVTRVAPTWPRSREPVNFESALMAFTCPRTSQLTTVHSVLFYFLLECIYVSFHSVYLSVDSPVHDLCPFIGINMAALLGLVAYIMIIRCTAYNVQPAFKSPRNQLLIDKLMRIS